MLSLFDIVVVDIVATIVVADVCFRYYDIISVFDIVSVLDVVLIDRARGSMKEVPLLFTLLRDAIALRSARNALIRVSLVALCRMFFPPDTNELRRRDICGS